MPVTPFVGLSIVVHLAVILWRRYIKPAPQKAPKAPLPKYIQQIWAYLIIAGTFSIIFLAAGSLVWAGATERHSTIYVLEESSVWLLAAVDMQTRATVAAAADTKTRGSFAWPEVASPDASQKTFFIIGGGIAALIFISFYLMQLFKFPRASALLLQGGYSLVQVSLLISGLIAIISGLAYLALYILLSIK